MQFAEVARAFDRLRETRARTVIVRLLADVLRDNPDDAELLAYLLQGRLGPPYAAPDLGLDERRIAEAISQASGHAPSQVWDRYQQTGDLAIVARELVPPSSETVQTRDVFNSLREIATTTGPGSNRLRVERFAGLVRRAGSGSDAALVGIASGSLRLGVGETTLIEAMSYARSSDSSLRPAIERAYSRCSDLGLVARVLFQEGEAALENIRPAPGRPVLSALAERLPSAEDVLRKLGDVVAEPKYDGVRIQAQKRGDEVWLFTRRLENVTAAFPDIVRGMREQVTASDVILDGEAVGYDPATGRLLPMQETARRRRTHGVEATASKIPVQYFAFDILDLGGVDLTALPYSDRTERLDAVVQDRPNGPIRLTPRTPVHTPAELEQHLEAMLRQGLEGTVAKKRDATYTAGARTYHWVKLKREYTRTLADTVDVVVVGYFLGRGRRANLGIGAFLGAVYDPDADVFRTVSRVGSGLTDAQWIELREMLDRNRVVEAPTRVVSRIVPDVWVEPRYVIEILTAGISRSPLHTSGATANSPGYSLRFPRALRLRPDRRAEDATTQAEVTEMYGLQK
jgi:DNA ligase-1